MSKIRPMYGRGNGKRIESRDQTEDLFGGINDKDENANYAMRCQAIISFLEGKRSDPALSHLELTHGVLLGGGEHSPFASGSANGSASSACSNGGKQ